MLGANDGLDQLSTGLDAPAEQAEQPACKAAHSDPTHNLLHGIARRTCVASLVHSP